MYSIGGPLSEEYKDDLSITPLSFSMVLMLGGGAVNKEKEKRLSDV
jgi:hypothetical protein